TLGTSTVAGSSGGPSVAASGSPEMTRRTSEPFSLLLPALGSWRSTVPGGSLAGSLSGAGTSKPAATNVSVASVADLPTTLGTVTSSGAAATTTRISLVSSGAPPEGICDKIVPGSALGSTRWLSSMMTIPC